MPSPSPHHTRTASPRQRPMSNQPPHAARPGAASGLSTQHAMAPSRRAGLGSSTQTITPNDSSRSISPEPLVLRLRGAHVTPESQADTSQQRRITWAEDVVDNEGLGRKSSKVCCIYHKSRSFGESSSEDDSSSDSSSSDSNGEGSDSPDDGRARITGRRRGRKEGQHDHKGHDRCGDDSTQGKGRRPSPNAYEKMPKYSTRSSAAKS